MSLLDSRITTKDEPASNEDVDKVLTILTNKIALYDEMNKIGMQKDSSGLVQISELLKSRKGANKRIKYYSSDGKPIYE
jgi:hypothetical protein